MASRIQFIEEAELESDASSRILREYRMAIAEYREMSHESKERAKGRRPKGRSLAEYRADMIRAESHLDCIQRIVHSCFPDETVEQIEAAINPEGFVAI